MRTFLRRIIQALSSTSNDAIQETFSRALRENPPPTAQLATKRESLQEPRGQPRLPTKESPPKYLYKYCSAARAAQILSDRYIYLCPIENLNDVFEGSVAPGLVYTPKVARELRVKQLVAAGCSRRLAEEVASSSSLEDCERLFAAFAKSILETNRGLRSNSGAACFSSSFSNQRLWGTYGDAHRGVCLEFWYDDGRSVIHEHARPVVYTNKDRSDLLLTALDDDGGLPLSALGFLFYLTKSVEWESEHEWRILMLRDTKPSDQERRLRFPPANLRRIFFGPRIASTDRDRLSEIAREFSSDWTLLDIEADIDTGRSNFVGVELIKGTEDFDWWFPRSK